MTFNHYPKGIMFYSESFGVNFSKMSSNIFVSIICFYKYFDEINILKLIVCKKQCRSKNVNLCFKSTFVNYTLPPSQYIC